MGTFTVEEGLAHKCLSCHQLLVSFLQMRFIDILSLLLVNS